MVYRRGAAGHRPDHPRRRYTRFPLPPNPFPISIAAGPDGALWFTGARLGIGRITTAGDVTEFPLPAGSAPAGIAGGRDGALWFSENRCSEPDAGPCSGKIGRITTDGTLTEFPIATADSTPAGIAAGRDGALWFTERRCFDSGEGVFRCSSGTIGRITTDGDVTEFPLPAESRPKGIAAGPDGALWLTEDRCAQVDEELECRRGQIGRITNGGAVTEYPLPPTDFPFPGAIAAGPDGAMWFTARPTQGARIGRITVPEGPRVSMKVRPRDGCASSAVTVTVKATGGAKLSRLVLLLDGKRLARTKRHRFQLRVNVRRLDPGTHRFKAVALDKTGGRGTKTRTFRRCAEPDFTG